MLHHPPTRRSLPRRRPHLAAPPRRQDGLDAARRTAQRSRDARDRLWAGALETLVTFIPATVALAFTVDDRRLRLPAMAYTGTNGGEQAEAVVRRFAETEPIDPFAVLRAELRGARVLSAADIDDVEPARSTAATSRATASASRSAPTSGGRPDRRRRRARPPRRAARLRSRRDRASSPSSSRCSRTRSPAAPRCPSEAASPPLTAREREVVEHVLAGESNAEIAVALGMSEKTVKTHLTHVYAKVGVRSRTELTVRLGAAPRTVAA